MWGGWVDRNGRLRCVCVCVWGGGVRKDRLRFVCVCVWG